MKSLVVLGGVSLAGGLLFSLATIGPGLTAGPLMAAHMQKVRAPDPTGIDVDEILRHSMVRVSGDQVVPEKIVGATALGYEGFLFPNTRVMDGTMKGYTLCDNGHQFSRDPHCSGPLIVEYRDQDGVGHRIKMKNLGDAKHQTAEVLE